MEEKTIHNFTGGDGANPRAGLCCSSKGAIGFLYGTAPWGGASGAGTVFKLKNAAPYPLVWVYSFTGGVDGRGPWGGVVLDTAGNVYGTATYGGANTKGTLFKLPQPPPPSPATPLYAFCSLAGCADGAFPSAAPSLNGSKLYGTAYDGGVITEACAPNGCGTVYDFTLPAGPLVTHWAFTGPAGDGKNPSGIVTDPAFPGKWYGTTIAGGGAGLGVVFEVP